VREGGGDDPFPAARSPHAGNRFNFVETTVLNPLSPMLTVVPCVAVCESTNRFARKRISSSYDDIALTVTPMQKDHKLSVTVANNNNNYYNNRFTTKDSYTWNITHNTGSTAV